MFVHGLLGNPLRTWRLHTLNDRAPSSSTVTGTESTQTVAGVTNRSEREEEDEDEEEDSDRSPTSSSPTEVIWPRDWLPSDVPNVRIISIGFRTFLSKRSGESGAPLRVRASEFLYKLGLARLGCDDRKVIWVTHSMGGLLAKQILMLAQQHAQYKSSVYNQTIGCVFYSTPHYGRWFPSLLTWFVTPSREVSELSSDSPHLAHLNDWFRSQSHISVLSFGESTATPIRPQKDDSMLKIQMVSRKSSNPGYGDYVYVEDTNHLNICKPKSKDDPIYAKLLEFINRCMVKAKLVTVNPKTQVASISTAQQRS